jgi:hypothetical protein
MIVLILGVGIGAVSEQLTASVAVRSAAAEAARQPIPDYTTRAVARLLALGVDLDARRDASAMVKPTRDPVEDPMDFYRRRVEELRRGG